MPLPKEPTLFLKATSALCGPTDDLVMPREAKSVDWEVELGVVIGKPGVYIAERDALDHVLGYCIGIDFSERDFQFNRGGQGFKGKSADTFAPLGPFLVTRDEVVDPQDLALRLSVNGKLKQNSSTRDMIFPVTVLVSYISRFMSLQPGDVILTGTPAGVGLGHKPPEYLKAGDVVTASIDGLGEQTHKVWGGRRTVRLTSHAVQRRATPMSRASVLPTCGSRLDGRAMIIKVRQNLLQHSMMHVDICHVRRAPNHKNSTQNAACGVIQSDDAEVSRAS